MAITGPFPETGVRVEIERRPEQGPPWGYHGHVVTPTKRWTTTVVVSAVGAVAVELARGAPDGIADRVRLIVRSAWKHAVNDGAPPPRRIVRWRGDR